MAAVADQFQPVTDPAPDWSAPLNWSERAIPAAGSAAVIAGAIATVDPGVTLSAALALEPGGTGGAELVGNGGAFTLGEAATLMVGDGQGAMTAGLFAADSLVNQGMISVGGAGAVLDVVVDLGAVSGQAGGPTPSFSNLGVISVVEGGLLEVSGTEFGNAGSIILDGGTLDVAGGNVMDTGYVQLAHSASARFSDGVEFQSFDFGAAAGGGTLSLADPWIGPGVTLANFGLGDAIDLTGQQASQLEIGGGALTLVSGGVTEGTLALATALAPGLHFAMVPAASGSAIVAEADPPCFAAGSQILTLSGYRPVEALAAGDRLVTQAGEAAIVWTGRRRVDIAAHPRPEAVRPVRVMRGAIADGVPRAALRLSPDHALYLDSVLIPVKHLVNGATIIREESPAVTYHHLELARHGVIFAEGAACETYLDTGNRAGFENHAGLTGDKRWDDDACAPLCTGGPVLFAVRRRLLGRARELGFAPCVMETVSLWVDGAPMRRAGAGFSLPARHGGLATLRSASFIPAEFAAGSDDGRRLGIALAGVAFGRGKPRPPVTGRGFHPHAPGDRAVWTDGAGDIVIPRARSLTLHVAALPRVWMKAGSPNA